MKYKTCPNCGAHLDPGEVCDCKEKEDAPAGTGAPSDEARTIVNSSDNGILPSGFPVVNADCYRLSELQKLTGAQAKEISEHIAKRFPSFTRQIFSQCASYEKYGCIPHPEVIRIIREVYDLPPVELSAPAPRRQSNGEKLTQRERILRHLNDYGSITSLEAMTEYGIMRLASRISDLKKAGYDIRSVTETGRNRYGEPTSYSRYYLAGGEAVA